MPDDPRAFYDDLAAEYDATSEDWDGSARRRGAQLALLLGDAEPVLDVAAGMGTHAIGLALEGRRVVARDLSPRLVERGRREAARLGVDVAFEVQDMRVPRPGDAGRFGAVIAVGNALPHLESDQDLRAALAAAREALRPGGTFLASLRDYDTLARERPRVDPARVLNPAPHRRIALQAWEWDPDGRAYTLDHLLLREEPEGWACRTGRVRHRALLRAELEAAAREAGLTTFNWLVPIESGLDQPVFTALRPG